MSREFARSTVPPLPRMLPGLTGLRGVAALWVLLYHMFGLRGVPILNVGYAGVDIFFILSGFVLSHVYLRDVNLTEPRHYLRFLGVRLARIYPLHVFTLCCLLALVIVWPDIVPPARRAAGNFNASAFIASLLLVQDWVPGMYASWNGPSWSLSAEWFAYLTFPLLLLPIRRITSARLLVLLAIGALCGMLAALYVAGYRATDAVTLGGMARMAGDFTAGCLLHAAFARGWRFPVAPAMAVMLALLAAGLALPSWRLPLVFSFALMVVLAAQGRSLFADLLEWRPVMLLGEISFSLYMTHGIVILLTNMVRRPDTALGLLALDGLVFSVALATAVATYHLVEMPARAWGRRLALAGQPSAVRPAILTPR